MIITTPRRARCVDEKGQGRGMAGTDWAGARLEKKQTTISHHLPCHDRSQLARDVVPRVYHGQLSSGLRLPLLLRWRDVVVREGFGRV